MSISVAVVVLLVAIATFGLAAAAVGHLPGLVPADPEGAGDGLPPGELRAEDLPRVRFGLALRGYRCSEVDAFVDRVAAQLASDDDQGPWDSSTVPAPPDSSSPSTSTPPLP